MAFTMKRSTDIRQLSAENTAKILPTAYHLRRRAALLLHPDSEQAESCSVWEGGSLDCQQSHSHPGPGISHFENSRHFNPRAADL